MEIGSFINAINLLKQYHADWIMIGITAFIAVLLIIFNLKKKQFFVYIGIALILSGATLAGLQLTSNVAGGYMDSETVSLITTIGSGILKQFQTKGVIFAGIGVALIILYVIIGSIRKKNKK